VEVFDPASTRVSKGLRYNLHYKQKNWKEAFDLEAETAKSNLDITEKQYYRQAVARFYKHVTFTSYMENTTAQQQSSSFHPESYTPDDGQSGRNM
jgi:hypothetical protein